MDLLESGTLGSSSRVKTSLCGVQVLAMELLCRISPCVPLLLAHACSLLVVKSICDLGQVCPDLQVAM